MQLKRNLLCAMGGLAVLALSSPSMALNNQSFETINGSANSFVDWDQTAGVQSKTDFRGLTATDGNRFATLWTNRESQADIHDLPAAEHDALAAFINYDLDSALGRPTYDGAAIRQSVTLTEDSLITFDWAFAHRSGSGMGNDAAFVIIDGVFQVIERLHTAAFTSSSPTAWQLTDWSTYTGLPILSAGTYDIIFGIVNVANDTGRSTLLLDNISIAAAFPSIVEPGDQQGGDNSLPGDGQNEAIPEPMTAGLTLLGLGALSYATRRRKVEGN